MMATMADGLKERENLYKLMISQLRYDGFEVIASNLAKVVNIISACPPMARLHQVVNLGIQAETEGVKPEQPVIPGLTPSVETKRGIDLEYEPEGNDLTGEWYSSSTSDESFMNNLKLQKVDQESGGERNDKADDAPSVNTVLHHILRITSDKKLSSEPMQDEKPATDSKPLTPNGDVLDAESICEQVKVELVKYNVSQEVFAKAVLGKSQGYLSEMLKHGESFFRPHDNTHYKGWLNFETMRRFLLKPEEERLMIYQSKGEELKMERLKRRQIEIGLTEDPSKKKRRLIPMEAKAVMEDYYHRNKYLSTNNRQCLANQLAIPEQCISDYFKNLRSRKKHEERMKNLLQDLENGHKQLDQVDSDTAEGSLEDEMDDQLPSCSQNLSAAAIREEPPPQARPPSQVKHSGRRYNVAPFQEPPAKNVSETDLVASKIAALTQSQKSPHKGPGTVQVLARRDSDAHQRVTALDHFPSREDSRREACNCPPSQPSSSGADAEERFSLDSLFNGSMMEPQDHGTSPSAAIYETYYVTAHKQPCRAASFSQNGRLISTGSVDASIKVLDVERMVAKNTMPQSQDQGTGTNLENHPVIRTLYDHNDEVTAVEFHPSALVLASGSKDCTVKLFDISKPSVKKAYRSIQEAEFVTSMSFHPTGDFILVGTEHPTIRLYDTITGQCFVSSNPREYHTGTINMVKYSPSANLYASCSKDGSIKIWDGVSNKCVQTFPQAHSGAEVYSVCFSQNSKYIVSSGKDSLVFLWELATGRALSMYTGASMSNFKSQIVFNHTEDFMIVADESNNSIACWDTRTTEKQKTLTSGHNGHIRCITHSPTGAAFVSCSDDFRARFWYCEGV